MKVHYTLVGEGAFPWLPLLRITLRGPTGALPLRMLVDSGAMETTVPESVLQELGVPITPEQVELVGVGGQRLIGRVATAELEIGEARLVTRLISIPDGLPSIPILGHRDFFLNFWVAFDSQNRVFHVAPQRRR